jgi:nucleotide-binding universal stress UspA family protein
MMFTRILVALDGSAIAERGLGAGIDLAARCGGRLTLLNVVEDVSLNVALWSSIGFGDIVDYMRESALDMLAGARRIAAEAGVHADVLLRQTAFSRVADIILREAQKGACDLIVIGTHGRRGFRELMLGSDADNVVRGSLVPVLLVPPFR